MTIRVIIADDEPLARQTVRSLLRQYREFEVMAECRTGSEVVDAVRAFAPDLLLLDIQMPDLDGFGALGALGRPRRPEVVIVSAYDEFALRAFDIEALDYLVKPFSDRRFHDMIDRVRRRFQAGAPPEARRLLVRVGVRSISVPVASIRWIEACGYHAKLHLEERAYLARLSLARLERELDRHLFLRVHRHVIVNLGHVREVRRHAGRGHRLLLTGGTELAISERRYARVMRVLGARALTEGTPAGA